MKEFPQSISGPEGLEGQIVEVKDIILEATGEFSLVEEIRKGNLINIELPQKEIDLWEQDTRDVFEYNEKIGYPCVFSYLGDYFTEKNKELLFKENGPFSGLRGKIVLDFGAGQYPIGYLVARQVEAKAYVAVEPFYADRLLNRLRRNEIENYASDFYEKNIFDKKANIPRSVSDLDILSFLRQVKDNSLSFMIFGQGLFGTTIPRKHSEVIKKEIYRVLDPEGLIVCDATIFAPKDKLEVERMEIHPDVIRVLRKKR